MIGSRRQGRIAAVAVALALVVGLGITASPASATPTGSISGAVTNPDNSPATSGCIYLYVKATGSSVGYTCVDGGGAYAFADVADGNYVEYFTNFPGAITEYSGGTTVWASATTVSVVGGGATVYDFHLHAAVTLSGTVTLPGGAPANGGCVTVYTPGQFQVGQQCGIVGGTFLIDHLQPSSDVKVSFHDFPGGAGAWYPGTEFSGSTTIHLTASGSTTLNYQLDAPEVVSGTITLPSGSPATDGCVGAYDEVGTSMEWDCSLGPDGSYSLGSLHAGFTYSFYFTAITGAAEQWAVGAQNFSDASPVTLGSSGTTLRNFQLAATSSISGHVQNPDGSAATGGCVTAYSLSGSYVAEGCVDGAGDYTLAPVFAGAQFVLYLANFDGQTGTEFFDGKVSLGTADAVTATVAPLTQDLVIGGSAIFPDVPVGNPFRLNVEWLVSAGIANGYIDGTFRPSSPVSRQAMAAFMFRMAGSPSYTPPVSSPFNDVSTMSTFYAEISWLADQAITTGFPDGGFHPAASVSRQAMAAFLYRYAGSPAFVPPVTPTFSDVPVSSPFYAEVEWLSSQGITTGYGDGTFHPSATVSRQAMAAFIYRYLNP